MEQEQFGLVEYGTWQQWGKHFPCIKVYHRHYPLRIWKIQFLLDWNQAIHIVPFIQVAHHLLASWLAIGLKNVTTFIWFSRPIQYSWKCIEGSIHILQNVKESNAHLLLFAGIHIQQAKRICPHAQKFLVKFQDTVIWLAVVTLANQRCNRLIRNTTFGCRENAGIIVIARKAPSETKSSPQAKLSSRMIEAFLPTTAPTHTEACSWGPRSSFTFDRKRCEIRISESATGSSGGLQL